MSKKGNYTNEFKSDAVKLVTEEGYRIPEAARNLGMSTSALRCWVKRGEDMKQAAIPEVEDMAKAQAQLKTQAKQIKRLEMEREILKKAAAFFANELA